MFAGNWKKNEVGFALPPLKIKERMYTLQQQQELESLWMTSAGTENVPDKSRDLVWNSADTRTRQASIREQIRSQWANRGEDRGELGAKRVCNYVSDFSKEVWILCEIPLLLKHYAGQTKPF